MGNIKTEKRSFVKEVSFKYKLLYNFKRYKYMYLLALPGLVYFLIFHYYPLYFLQIAFKEYTVFTGLGDSPWVGFKHFRDLFNSQHFLEAFRNTLILSFMYRVLGFPIPIILALLLNEIRKESYKRTVQTLIYLPHFLSWVIVGSIWTTLLSPENGLINELLKLVGVDPIFFMADRGLFRWVLFFTNVWKESGWSTIIYLAAISGIDESLYEAAIIDGANRIKQTFYVTIPSIMPTIVVVFVLSLAKVLNLFEQVFVMYNPVVAEVSETIDTYVYQIGMIRGDFSFATAVGLFKNVISATLVILTNRIVRKTQGYKII